MMVRIHLANSEKTALKMHNNLVHHLVSLKQYRQGSQQQGSSQSFESCHHGTIKITLGTLHGGVLGCILMVSIHVGV